MAEVGHGEPMPKKRKTEEEDLHPIFQSELASKIKNRLELCVNAGLRGMSLGVLFVDSSNALDIASFTESTLRTSALSLQQDADYPVGASVADIFADGVDILLNYLDKEHPKIPEDHSQQKALQILLTFLTSKEDHEVLFEEINKEPVWSVTLAQHLFSKLAVDSTYTIASSPDFTVGESTCPCKKRDELLGKVGDTSYGCMIGWHGHPDIIMEIASTSDPKDSVPISVFQGEDDNNVPEDQSDSSVEMEVTDNFSEKDTRQILAQTIVFSFLQRKLNKGKLKNYLIPGVGIASKYFIISFYDSENDVLLESKPVEFIEGKSIRTLAVLFLWLTLNYRLFCSGITHELKAMKSDFMRKLGDNLTMYTEDVMKPVHVQHSMQHDLYPWGNEPVLSDFINKPSLKYINLPVQ